MNNIFSRISINGEVSEGEGKLSVLANCLNDWGCCMNGAKPPENFGKGMVAASEVLGVTADPKSLMKLVESLKVKSN